MKPSPCQAARPEGGFDPGMRTRRLQPADALAANNPGNGDRCRVMEDQCLSAQGRQASPSGAQYFCTNASNGDLSIRVRALFTPSPTIASRVQSPGGSSHAPRISPCSACTAVSRFAAGVLDAPSEQHRRPRRPRPPSWFPPHDGYGVAECLISGDACGQAVADAWCEAQGYVRAVRSGRSPPTRTSPASVQQRRAHASAAEPSRSRSPAE